MILYYTYNRAIFLHFQILVHMLYTIFVFFLDPCVRMEILFEAMRFVSILLDFSKNKTYTWDMHTGDSWF